MKKIHMVIAMIAVVSLASCGQTTQKDNTTKSADTAVMMQNKTDSATNTVSTDTTKR